jgi:hypothetical protein
MSITTLSRKQRAALKWSAIAAAAALSGPIAWGDTHSWVGLNPYPWWDYGDNWSPVGQPANTDSAHIYRSGVGSYSVLYWNTLYPTAVLNTLILDQTGGGSVILSMTQNHYLSTTNELIGYRSDGRGAVVQSVGTHTISDDLYLGINSGSVGSYTLNGGSLINDTGNQYIGYGYGGRGAFSQGGGTNIVGNSIPETLYLGYGTNSYGSYQLTGAAAQLGAGMTQVGYQGGAYFTHSDGSHGALAVNVGVMGSGTGVYALIDGSLHAYYYENIGSAGAGSFYHNGGTNLTHEYLTIGGELTGRGNYVISGGTLSVSQTGHAGHLYIGSSGVGTLFQAGGVVNVDTASAGDSLMLGYTSSGVGTYLLQAGTLTTNGKQSVGFAGTVASHFVQTGGTNNAAELRIGELSGARGIYQLSGTGVLSVNGAEFIGYSGVGTFLQDGGTHSSVYGGSLVLGANSSAVGYYALSGGSLGVSGQMIVGQYGVGTFVHTAGTHTALFATLGSGTGSSGSYSLTGATSGFTIIEDEIIGASGVGTFIQGGGSHSVWDFFRVGSDVSGRGNYVLSAGTLNSGNGAYVGDAGLGTINQSGGVNNVGIGVPVFSLYLGGGFSTGGSGTYLLSGSGVLNVGGNEYVGYAGHGTFIQNGGTNTIGSPNGLVLGHKSGATGYYRIGGGTLSSPGNITVGMSGTGMFIQNSGLVNFGTSSLALGTYVTPTSTRGTGTYLMGGGTLLGGWINIGDPGFGTFIQTGGYVGASTVKVANYRIDLANYPTGYYRLDSGTLSAGDLMVGYEGAGTFVHNGGSANVASYLVLGSRPSGPGGVYTLGSPGVLHVGLQEYIGFMSPGAFTQTGGTHIVDGTLTIGGVPSPYTLQGGMLSVGTVHLIAGTFTQTGGTLAVAHQFINSGKATVAGVQKWSPGSLFQHAWLGAASTFNTDAGSVSSRNLTVHLPLMSGTATFNSTQHLSGLLLENGSLARLPANGHRVLVTGSLSIESSPTPLAKLDLADNDMIWDYSGLSPVQTVRSHIAYAWNGGAWNRNGITSSLANAATYALGYADNAALGMSNFAGEAVDPSSVLVKFTYYGDADLNGKVDINDLGMLASHWQTPGPWTSGDFDYSGSVNVADLGLLATNWQRGVGAPLAGSLGEALAQLGLPPASVPEATSLVALVLAAMMTRRQPRQRGPGRRSA